MYIDISEGVKKELYIRLSEATKYNGEIFRLTELNEHGNHGDIIKYLQENKLDTDQLQDILIYFIQGLNREV